MVVPRLATLSSLVLCSLVAVVLGFAPAALAGAVTPEVLVDQGTRVVLRFAIEPPATIGSAVIAGQPYVQLSLPGEAISLEAGAPAVPFFARSVVVPSDGTLEVRVIDVRFEERALLVAPSKGNLMRGTDPASVPFVLGDAYARDAFWPGSWATLSEPYVLRDRRGVVVRVFPVQVNPARGIARVASSITIEVVRTGPGGANNLPLTVGGTRVFRSLQAAHFVNAATSPFSPWSPLTPASPLDASPDYPGVSEEGDLLVICHDPFCASLASLESHKEGLGIATTIKPVSEIGNDSTSIKNYIQQVFDTTNLAFVLLVGDAAQVATPGRSVGGENGAADPLYAKLAGSDNYPDILVGRFSASSQAQVDTQVQRTIDYESLPAPGQDWYWRATGIASAEGAGQGDEGQSDIQHESQIRDWLLAGGYTNVDQIYDPGARDSDVADALNAGRGLVNYTGHGSSSSWGTTGFNNADVNALVNDDRLPFIFSVACNNGEFHHYDSCFAETWLRATHEGRPTGAVAMYASSVSQAWAPPMEAQDEFNLLLTNASEPYSLFGGLCFAASSSMMDAYGTSGVEMFDTWNIFGDPSLRIVGEATPAAGLVVTPGEALASAGAAGGPFAPESKDYLVRNAGISALTYRVSADRPWIVVTPASGVLAGGETVTVTVSVAQGACHLDNGAHGGSVRFENVTDHDGDTSRGVSVQVGVPGTIHAETCDHNPGWSTTGEWAWGVPQGGGGAYDTNPDPASGATGTTVFGANLAGDISTTLFGPYYLTAGPFDLVGIAGTTVRFERWLNTLGPPYGFATIEASSDGSSWTEIWRNASEVTDAAWTAQEYDVAGLADGRGAFYLRFGYGLTRNVPFAGSGWNIDDIRVRGVAETARIVLTVDRDAISWTAVRDAGAYDVVRGSLGTLLASGGDFALATQGCAANDIAGLALPFAEVPEAGDALWLLVRGVGDAGGATYQALALSQQGIRDGEIAAAPATCP